MRLDKRHWFFGLKSGFRWMKNPVSAEGSMQVPRAKIAITGPDILKEVEAMRAHPIGGRLMREKPDITETFDSDRLTKMPAGSFGNAFLNMINQPDTLPGYLVAGLAYRDGFFDSLEIDEDTRWYLERGFFDHDAMHLISGYMTDLTGEALAIFFVSGYQSNMPKWFAFANPFGVLSMAVIPKCGFLAWFKYLSQAFDRGRAARRHYPPHSIPYEDLLEKPMREVREFLGVSPLPDGWDTSDWLDDSPLGRRIMSGNGKLDEAKVSAHINHSIVEAGIPWRSFMRASEEKQAELRASWEQYNDLQRLRELLAI